MTAAVLHNTSPTLQQDFPLSLNLDVDVDSIFDIGAKLATTITYTERQEAKLQLLCTGYFLQVGVASL